MKKRLLALILTLVMVIGTVSTGASADTGLTEDNMTSVILSVKERLDIGDEFTDFHYDFYEDSNNSYWNMDWNDDDYSSWISATCDIDGHITYYYRSSRYETKAPAYTRAELADEALAAVTKIAPETEGRLVLAESSTQLYRSCYVYRFNRIENGIEMPDNYVTITLDYRSMQPVSFNASWLYDADIPAAEGLISKDAAASAIDTSLSMTLEYFAGYDDEGNTRVFLAYVPDTGYLAVDAISGELYNTKNTWSVNSYTDSVATEAAADNSLIDRYSLSEAETAEIEKLGSLISKDDAIALVRNNEALYLDDNITTVTASLMTADDSYIWYISFSDDRPIDWDTDDWYRANAAARIDAQTGKLLSYSASTKNYYYMTEDEIAAIKINYTEKQCRKKLVSFLRSVAGDRYDSSVLTSTGNAHKIAYDYDTGESSYAGYSFTYTRCNEDILFRSNYLQGSVDAITGKIISYYANWDDSLSFPSPESIIDEAAAFDSYIAYDGFDLVYEVVNDTVNDEEYGTLTNSTVRLVYRTEISPAYVDAFTGKQLDASGSEYIYADSSIEYSDIAGTEHERAITLLADMGIGFDGSEFKPDALITRAEFQQLLDSCSMVADRSYVLRSSRLLTRQIAAKALVSALGYGRLAELPIYKTGYDDEASISSSKIGYVALAEGLGLMGAAYGSSFDPTAGLTRGEAAELILNLIDMAE